MNCDRRFNFTTVPAIEHRALNDKLRVTKSVVIGPTIFDERSAPNSATESACIYSQVAELGWVSVANGSVYGNTCL